MIDLDIYRIRRNDLAAKLLIRWQASGRRVWIVAARVARYLTWRRTWQAEWTGCTKAPRGYTRRGVERKARRVTLRDTP